MTEINDIGILNIKERSLSGFSNEIMLYISLIITNSGRLSIITNFVTLLSAMVFTLWNNSKKQNLMKLMKQSQKNLLLES